MMRCWVIVVVVCWWVLAASVRADTGQLRDVVTAHGMNVVVFTSPTPLRAGEVEVAVLVTDAKSGTPLKDVALEVSVRDPAWDPTFRSMQIAGGPDPTDPLRMKAVFDLQRPGTWLIAVTVRHNDQEVSLDLDVVAGERMPRWWQILPVAVLGAPFVVLVVVRDHLRRAHSEL